MKYLFKAIGWLLKFTFAILLLLTAASAIIIALEIKVELDPLRQPVAAAASQALDREVRLDGSVSLVPTLWPTLEISDVSIGSPKDWPGDQDLAKVGLVRLKLGVVPLLSGEINVAEATAEGVTLNLVSNAQGIGNWEFGDGAPATESEVETAKGDEPIVRLEAIQDLDLSDIDLHFRDAKLGKKLHFRLARMEGRVVGEEPFEIAFEGHLKEKPYRFEFTGGSLNDLRGRKVNWPVKLTGMVVDTPVNLEGELIREGARQLKAELDVGAIDVGATLAWLNVVEGLQITADGLSADLVLEGTDLTSLLEQADASIVLKDARWDVQSRDKKSSLPLVIQTGEIGVKPGKPLTITLDATVDQEPVGIRITGSTLLDYTKQGAKLPLVLNLDAGGAEIELSTQVERPIDTKNLALQLNAKGRSLDGFDPLLNTDLPPLGPYSLTGEFAMTPKGYEVRDLTLTVRESQLNGQFALDAIARPYGLDISLHSPQLQLNDFDTGDWSSRGEGKDEPEPEQKPAEPTAEEQAAREKKKAKLRKLLSQETLSKIDARIEVKVDQVLSGPDKLGDGQLVLNLEQARLTLDPVKIGLPGGDATMSFLYHPQGNKGDIAVKALVEQFDYGVLARRIDPQTDITGHLSLDVDLAAHINDPNALFKHAEGHFDFGLWPGDMDASLFDLWAVNVVTSLMSEVDKEESSKVNCIIVGFTAEAGVMQQKVIFADTSEMRIGGKAKVDFRNKTIDIYAAPKAKSPQMFSLAVPVAMTGTFDKFGVNLNPIDLTTTTVSFITSPFHVPVRSLFSDDKEVDGEQACQIAWAAVREDDLAAVPGAKGENEATSPAKPQKAAAPTEQTEPEPANTDEAVGIPDIMTY